MLYIKMEPKYDVPIIPSNLRREETIIQIAEALQYLSDVSTDIFRRINTRIDQNRAQVSDLSSRIATASTKVNKLAGAKKATRLFSSSKYPGEKTNQSYKSIFDNKQVLPHRKFNYEYKSAQVGDEHLEQLQFYYVKLKTKSEKHLSLGLGNSPTDLETVNDILIFNTGRNAYDKGKNFDKPNSSMSNVGKKGKEDSEFDIGAAPYSMSQGQSLGMQRVVGSNYFYSPHLGNVPTIDVPLDLPDLPGIADDLRYQTNEEPNIAPSIAASGLNLSAQFATVIPHLPTIGDEVCEEGKSTPDKEVVAKPVELVPTTAKVETTMDTELTLNSANRVYLEEVKTSPEVIGQVKPVIKKGVEEIKQKPKPTSAALLPQISDGQASLMNAIRNAGGLKSLKPRKEQNALAKKDAAPAGDLMADLHAKLSMRRKGISGNKAENPTTMDKISEMIPPPPATQSDKSDSAEEEWDD